MSIELESPVPVHMATTNAEAQLIAVLLTESGIPAYAVDDVSTVGYFSLGTLPGLLRPLVYVDKSRLTEAREVFAAHRGADAEHFHPDFCHHCGASWTDESVPPTNCPECGAEIRRANDDASDADIRYESKSRRVFLVMRRFLAALLLLPLVLWVVAILADIIRTIEGR